MILILLATIFILIIKGINANRMIGVFMCLIIITLTVLMAKKLKNWEYLLHIQILLHLSIIVIAIEMIIETYKYQDDKIYEIMGVPIHLSFFCILLTRLNWLLCAIFYFFFNIFYVLRVFTFERIENQPMIIVLHIICVIGFSFMVYYQEKTTRIFYQLIHDSNQNSLQFELVMKNIFPSPIFIIDFNYKKLKFFNNAANEFMDDFNDEGIISISPREQKNRYLSEEIENFIEKVNNFHLYFIYFYYF